MNLQCNGKKKIDTGNYNSKVAPNDKYRYAQATREAPQSTKSQLRVSEGIWKRRWLKRNL